MDLRGRSALCSTMNMWRRVSVTAGACCVLLSALSASPRTAQAAGGSKLHPAATRKPHPIKTKKRAPPAITKASGEPTEEAASAGPANPQRSDASTVKAAGTGSAQNATPGAAVATVQEDKAGVKTFHFGTVEVEGRTKSPQIIYFLRRVRAEFDAGLLGHRSFMRELSDTRNASSLR